MAHQIVYTSAPRGLTPGSKGYCTVVASNGMAPTLQRQLESLSQYNHIYPPNTANDTFNPTNFQYSKASFGGKQLCVLSRVSDAGLDYSRRSNLLAHHVALEPDECNVSGPAALIDSLLLPPSVKRWKKPPQRLDIGSIPNPPCPTSPMTSHHPLGLRPELVGEIAGRLANSNQQIMTVLYRQEQHAHLLPLVIDVFWLLAPRERWNTTFSTYYSADLQSTDCRLRFIPHGTPNAKRVMLEPDTIDLNQNMTVLDSEMVKAAREAAKTGNRTLAHPRAAESGHSTGESFTRAPLHASVPRAPFDPYHKWLGIPPKEQPAGPRGLLGISADEDDPQVVREAALRQTAFVRQFSMGEHGEHADRILGELADARDSILSGKVESHLQPPPIAQPVTQAQSNQHRHKNPETVEVGKFSENQDRHSSGARKKLMIAILFVTAMLLLGIIAIVALNSFDINQGDSVQRLENANAGKQGLSSTQAISENNQHQGNKVADVANQDSHGSIDGDGNQDRHDMFDGEGHGSEENGENVNDMSEMPLKTGTKTEYKVHLKNRDILYVDHQTLISSPILKREIYDDQDRFSKIREKRISLRQSQAADLQSSQTDERQITLGLKNEGDQELLDIELTDDPNNQLVFKWREEIDPARISDLKEKLSAELMKTVLLVPYFLEETSESHQKVRMCVVAFGSMNDSPIEKPAFPEHGIYSLSSKDSSVFARAINSVSASDNPTIKVTANLPKYNAQDGHIQVNKILDANEEKTEFNSQSFWQNGVGISEYKPEILFFLKTLTDEVQYGFKIKEIKYKGPNDKESSFEVFKYLNAISNSDKDKYLWDPEKHEVKEIPKGTNAKDKARIYEENDKIKRAKKAFHQKFAFDLGKDFLEKRPTSSYEVARANISPTNIDKWIKGAVEYGDDLNLSELEKLKIAKQINERMFEHLPDVEKLASENGAFKAIDISKNTIFTNGRQLVFDKDKDLREYRKTCKNLLDNKYLEPMELEQKTKDLTRWSETLHGLFNIRNNLKTFPIQIQIEVELSFELPENYGMNNTIRMAGKPKRMDDNSKPMADNSKPPDESTDDLVVPILRLGDVPLIKN
jgi:hypothetical protein